VLALAQKVAARVKTSSGGPAVQVSAAYQLLFARSPADREQAAAAAYLQGNSLERLCHALLASSEFSYRE
jgi:hypothetical protein